MTLRSAPTVLVASSEQAVKAQIRANAAAMVRTLEQEAGAHALKALLHPREQKYHTGAFFREAKARRIEFALHQLESSMQSGSPNFAERARDLREFLESCQRHFASEAYSRTHALMGRDPTTEAYIASRVEAVQAQGRDEAYMEMLEMLDEVLASKGSALLQS